MAVDMADQHHSSSSTLPFCNVMTPVTLFPAEQQDLESTSLTVLYSNVHSLRQAYGELCKICSDLHLTMICLTEIHLFEDVTDSFCPAGYVVAAHSDRSQHGGGVIIMVQENIFFDEIDTTAVSIPELSEVVAIKYCEFLIVCCYRQPSTNNSTLFSQLDMLLDSNNLLFPVICGDFNAHETSWLNSSHTSTAGTAALDFCESRGLHQLVQFSTRQDAILDLILSKQIGSTSRLPNLNTSDHVAILLSLATASHHPVITPPSHRVFHWSNAPWKNSHNTFILSNGIFKDLLTILLLSLLTLSIYLP